MKKSKLVSEYITRVLTIVNQFGKNVVKIEHARVVEKIDILYTPSKSLKDLENMQLMNPQGH